MHLPSLFRRREIRTQKRRQLDRRISLERLELRQMLDGNNPPTIDWGNGQSGGSIALNGGESHYFSLSELGYQDIDGDALDHITILSLPTQGTLTLGNVYNPVTSGQSIDAASLEYGYLVYTPNANADVSYSTSFAFSVNDGQASSLPASLTLNVDVPPNSPPVVTGSEQSLYAADPKTISIDLLGYSDEDNDALQSITITAPSNGTLLHNGVAVSEEATIPVAELINGLLVYLPSLETTSSYTDALMITASDGSDSSSPAAILFSVDLTQLLAPTVTGGVVNVSRETTTIFTLADFGYSDPNDDQLDSITIISLPESGTLSYSGGVPIELGANVSREQIEAGSFEYTPNPSHPYSYSESFSFTASDGQNSSDSASMILYVVGLTNIAPTTSNRSVTVPTSGALTLSTSDFPYADTEGDVLTHVTLLSLPSTASLVVNGVAVSFGQSLSVDDLNNGLVELVFESSTGGAPLASFSFSVENAFGASAAATCTATRIGYAENRRPTTSNFSIAGQVATTRWLTLADFPFSDTDTLGYLNQLDHVNILNLPPGATLVDRTGNVVASSTPLTAAMLAGADIGIAIPDAAIDDSFNVVYTVSDGILDSFPAIMTITIVSSVPIDGPEAIARIDLTSSVGPTVILDDGFTIVAGSLLVPDSDRIFDWRDGVDDAGVLVTLADDAWIYTETHDVGPTDDFGDSLAYVFVAAGVGDTLTRYSLTVTGIDDGTAPGSDITDLPEGAPVPNIEANSLNYSLDVSVAADGTVASSLTSGRYHVSDYDALIDEAYSSSSETVSSGSSAIPAGASGIGTGGMSGIGTSGEGTSGEGTSGEGTGGEGTGGEGTGGEGTGGEGTGGEGTSGDGTGGGTSGSGSDSDPITTTYTGSGTYTLIIASSTTLTFDSAGTNVIAGVFVFFNYSGSGTYGPAPVTGTYTESGTLIASAAVNGRILLDGTPAPLSFVDTWFDQATFSYAGGGTYAEDGVTYIVTENGLDTFVDQGTVFVVLNGEDVTVGGESSINAMGNHFYDNSWSGPLEIDDETSDITGTLSGSVTLSDSYNDFIEFEVGLIEPEASEPSEPPTPEDDEPTYGWLLVGGTFNDFALFKIETNYNGSGTYSTTGGRGPVQGGGGEDLDTPITGTIVLGGKSKTSLTYNAAGSFDDEDVTLDAGSLNLHDSADSFATINATGTINSGGLSGTITIYDHFEIDTLRDLTFDLTVPELTATGFGHDFVSSDSNFDQIASGPLTLDGMSGTQWANIHDHAFTEIDAHYIWNDSVDEEAEDDARIGWETTSATFTVLRDAFSNVGYDVSGMVTRDGLTGFATDYAKDFDSDFLHIKIAAGTLVEPLFEFTSLIVVDNQARTSETLTGTVSETLEPSGAVLSLAAHRTTRDDSKLGLTITSMINSEGDVTTEGLYSISSDHFADVGRSGSGPYSRVDGDTTFTGSASLTESSIIDTGVFLLFSLDEDGEWQLGASRPNADFDTGRLHSNVTIIFDTSYFSSTGVVDGTVGPAHWTGTAGESGFANFHLFSNVLGIPSVAPPAPPTSSGVGEGPNDAPTGGSGGSGDGTETDDGEDSGGLPELIWTYSGTLDIGSRAGGVADRDATAIYASGTLTGSLAEKYHVDSTVTHDEFHNLSAAGDWVQETGENRAISNVTFLSSQDLSGPIGSDHEHSSGLTGTVIVKSFASGGSNYLRVDTFTPPSSSSGTPASSSWTSTGEKGQHLNYSSLVDVNLSGTVVSGGMSINVSYGMLSHSSGYVFENHDLVAAAVAGEYEWKQTVGAEGDRVLTRSNSSRNGSNSEGHINEITRSRDETTTWRRLTPGTSSWTNGGYITEDYFLSSDTGTSKTESLSFPVEGGGTLSGESYSISNQNLLTVSYTGKTLGSGAAAPDDANDPDLGKKTLPSTPENAGSAGGANGGGVSTDPGTDYGVLTIANSGGSSSGFSLEGTYDVDSGGATPATALRTTSSEAVSGYNFMLVTVLDTVNGQWENTSGQRTTSDSFTSDDSLTISGSWATNAAVFNLSGTYTSLNSTSTGGGSSSFSTLNPATGIWTTFSSDSSRNVSMNNHIVDGQGTYQHTDYGFLVSGTVTVNHSDLNTQSRIIGNSYIDGVRTSASNGVGFRLHTTGESFILNGSGADSRVTTDIGNIVDADGNALGISINILTVDDSVVESRTKTRTTLDRTDDRYDLATGSLIPSQRTDFLDAFSSTGGHVTIDHTLEQIRVDYAESGPFSSSSRSRSLGKERMHSEGQRHESSMHFLTGSLEGPLAGTLTGVRTGGFGGDASTELTTYREGESEYEYRSPGDVRTGGSENGTGHKTIKDSEIWQYTLTPSNTNTGFKRYFGSVTSSGTDATKWDIINGVRTDQIYVFMPHFGPALYDVTISTSDVDANGYPTKQPPMPFRSRPGVPEAPGYFLAGPIQTGRAVIAGVAELQAGVAITAAANVSDNSARDQTFAALAEDADALGEDDNEDSPKVLLTIINTSVLPPNNNKPDISAILGEYEWLLDQPASIHGDVFFVDAPQVPTATLDKFIFNATQEARNPRAPKYKDIPLGFHGPANGPTVLDSWQSGGRDYTLYKDGTSYYIIIRQAPGFWRGYGYFSTPASDIRVDLGNESDPSIAYKNFQNAEWRKSMEDIKNNVKHGATLVAGIGVFIGTIFIPGPEDLFFAAFLGKTGITAIRNAAGNLEFFKDGSKLAGEAASDAEKSIYSFANEYLSSKIFRGIKSAPNYPLGFRLSSGLNTTKNNIKDNGILSDLRNIERGDWKKVYKDGFDANGNKISLHYFESQSGQIFNFKVVLGWSN